MQNSGSEIDTSQLQMNPSAMSDINDPFQRSQRLIRSPVGGSSHPETLSFPPGLNSVNVPPVVSLASETVVKKTDPTKKKGIFKKTTPKESYEDLQNTCTIQQKLIYDLNSRIAELESRFNTASTNQQQPTLSQHKHNHTNSSNWLLRQFPTIQNENIYDALSQEEYFTDEEELAKEVNNVDNKNKKKRRRISTKSPPADNNQSKNKSTVSKNSQINEVKPIKTPMPPPINVYNIVNFNNFRKQLLEHVKGEIKFNALSNNVIKITCQSEEEYRNIKHFLIQMNENLKKDSNKSDQPVLEYHTYQLKSEKLYRFVIRGLPPSIDTSDILDEIQQLGHEVSNVLNIQKKKNVNGEQQFSQFPLFYVDIKQREDNQSVYNIKELLNCKIKIEPPRKNNDIPQCTNCQQLGHTKSFCYRQAVCVKCAGNHHTTSCTKTRNSEATCALCKGKGHPANYKGCPEYQKKIKTQQTKTSVAQRVKETINKTTEPITPSTSGLSYAQATKMSTDNHIVKKLPTTCTEPTIADVMKLLSSFQADVKNSISQLNNRMDRLENKPSQSK